MRKKSDANLHIRLPAKLKRGAEKVLEALGLDSSSAIRLFYTQLTLQQTLPFPLPKLRVMSPRTHKIVSAALKDDVIGPFSTPENALKALYAAT
ncbi:MAG: type II toxin-antitoxin system RelB/DinJ family antitoxin [Candidatus Peregrinibacteria bacterium]